MAEQPTTNNAKLNVLIVDDDEATRMLMSRYVEQTEFLNLIGISSDGIEASNAIEKEDVHLIFLDIEMPGMDGMELINTLEKRPQIILITSKEKYAIEAFELDVTDYLLKPIQYSRFLKASKRAQRNHQDSGKTIEAHSPENYEPAYDEQAIFIKVKSRLIKVKTKDIFWIQAKGDYVDIKTKDETYTIHSTMKVLENRLPANTFQRAHRSYIVNTEKIKVIDEGMLVIEEKLIPVGNKYQKQLMQKLNMLNK